jgi:hypothetical protein
MGLLYPQFSAFSSTTQFIEAAKPTHDGSQTVGHGLRSYTSDIRTVDIPHWKIPACSVTFVDTPGFDDTYKSDTEILGMIANWLVKT